MEEMDRQKSGFVGPVAAAACWWIALFLVLAALTVENLASSPALLRVVAVAAAALALGIGFFLVYAGKRKSGGYVGLRRFNSVMIWVTAASVAAYALIPREEAAGEAAAPAAAAPAGAPPAIVSVSPGVGEERLAAAATRTLAVKGMVCQSCVETVTEALLGVPGVLAAHVDLESGSAVVSSDTETAPPDSALVDAVVGAGYRAWRTDGDQSRDNDKGEGHR
jgi:copper chaperone CopZ